MSSDQTKTTKGRSLFIRKKFGILFVTHLNIDSILVFGSWNFKKTRKTRMRISGLGERMIDQ